jgi:hypothetical protein
MLTSAVFILPAAMRDAGNTLAENMGWGSNCYSVPLSPTGSAPATHWGARADVPQSFFDLLADPPAEAAPVLAELFLDTMENCDDRRGHMDSAAAKQGLQVVENDV